MSVMRRLFVSLPLVVALGALTAHAEDPGPADAGAPPAVSAEAEPASGAAEGPDFDRNALYVRGGITLSFDATSLVFFADVDNGVGVGGAIGYRLHPRIALEGQIEWQGNQDIALFSVSNVASISRWDATANAKLFLATGRWQPYAVAGLGYVRATGICNVALNCPADASADSFLVRLGGGLDVYITRNIGVYAEGAYMLATTDIVPGESFPDYGTVGAGVIFAF